MRTIGEVLTNNTDKPLSNPLFGAIIKQTGYCNGSSSHKRNVVIAIYNLKSSIQRARILEE
jgi:hypothetical protein